MSAVGAGRRWHERHQLTVAKFTEQCKPSSRLRDSLSLINTSAEQVRANAVNHTVLISTPCRISTHVADPVDTCRGTIRLPPDYSDDDIVSTLRKCNLELTIGGTRRLGNTEAMPVIFQDKIVPFYVNYDGMPPLQAEGLKQKPALDAARLGIATTSAPLPTAPSAPSVE
ncbi:hypothetical protein HPB50_013253 [Hyalomma asiaticum]|uniref:Uncharacterized protein n=1 Tax=Hyalomma asiaticum TaxID=266040 RepID=A0ACB7SH06_HYAAI|nr:hypothetical protein HPB50_013253 [Hyalomma asiaticum]